MRSYLIGWSTRVITYKERCDWTFASRVLQITPNPRLLLYTSIPPSTPSTPPHPSSSTASCMPPLSFLFQHIPSNKKKVKMTQVWWYFGLTGVFALITNTSVQTCDPHKVDVRTRQKRERGISDRSEWKHLKSIIHNHWQKDQYKKNLIGLAFTSHTHPNTHSPMQTNMEERTDYSALATCRLLLRLPSDLETAGGHRTRRTEMKKRKRFETDGG